MDGDLIAANILSLEKAEGIKAYFLRKETPTGYELTVAKVPYAAIVELTFKDGGTGHQAEYVLSDPYGILYPVSSHDDFLFVWIHDTEPSAEFIKKAIMELKNRQGNGKPLKLLSFKKGDKDE